MSVDRIKSPIQAIIQQGDPEYSPAIDPPLNEVDTSPSSLVRDFVTNITEPIVNLVIDENPTAKETSKNVEAEGKLVITGVTIGPNAGANAVGHRNTQSMLTKEIKQSYKASKGKNDSR